MNMELLNEHKVNEGTYNYWANVKLLNQYRIIEQKLIN